MRGARETIENRREKKVKVSQAVLESAMSNLMFVNCEQHLLGQISARCRLGVKRGINLICVKKEKMTQSILQLKMSSRL